MASGDLVGTWDVKLNDGIHKVQFEHGTTSGKRVIRCDGEELLRTNWMFKLVGKENFKIGKTPCVLRIEAVTGFAYEYTLEVNGKSLEKFSENQSKVLKSWIMNFGETGIRVTLEKDTLDVWVNGRVVESTGEFVEDGTETHFEFGDHAAFIKAESSGKRRSGIIHRLVVDGIEVPEAVD